MTRTPTMRTFMSWSMWVRLNVVCPLFIISFVSLPANITRPKHQPVLRKTQPRSNSLSLSRANFSSLQFNTPSNLFRWLFGGSHNISPAQLHKQVSKQNVRKMTRKVKIEASNAKDREPCHLPHCMVLPPVHIYRQCPIATAHLLAGSSSVMCSLKLMPTTTALPQSLRLSVLPPLTLLLSTYV